MLCYLGMSNLFDAPHSWTWCTLEQIYRICCSFPLHQQGFQLTWHRTRILLNNLILMILVWYRWSPTCIALLRVLKCHFSFRCTWPPHLFGLFVLLDVLKLLKAHYTREDPNITIACQTTTQLGADIGFEPNVQVYTVVSFKRTAPQLNQPGLLLQTALCKFSSAGALVHSDTLLHGAGKSFSHFANTEQPLRQQGTAEAEVCPPSLPQLDWDTPTPHPGQGREKAGSLRVISF